MPSMGMRKTAKVLPMAVSSDENATLAARVALATHDLKLEPLTAFGTWKAMLTNSWMGLGDKVPTDNLGDSLKENFVNVGVVGALLLTLVFISTEGVGDKTEAHGMTQDTASQIYAFLSSLALWCLFICVLHALITHCIMSELNCLDEVISWTKSMGQWIHIHYLFFILGFLLYVASQLWLAFTVLSVPVFCATVAVLFLLFPLPLFATFRGIRSLYQAKVDLTAMHTASSNDESSSRGKAEAAVTA